MKIFYPTPRSNELFVMLSFMFAIIMYVFIASNLLQGRNNLWINEYKTTANDQLNILVLHSIK